MDNGLCVLQGVKFSYRVRDSNVSAGARQERRFLTIHSRSDRLRMGLRTRADCDSRYACGHERRGAGWPGSSGRRSVIRVIPAAVDRNR